MSVTALLLILTTAAGPSSPQFKQACKILQPSSLHSVSLRRLSDGQEIYSQRPDTPRRIASVSKLFTVATALQRLGSQYGFRTAFYADGVVGPSVNNLYIKGYGDPFLVSEEWQDIVAALPIVEIRGDIIVDDSYFSPTLDIVREPGVPNPYNARNAAFATNFNTIEVTVKRKRIYGEPQTPVTPFTIFDVRPTKRGSFFIDTQQSQDGLLVQLKGPFGRRAKTMRFNLGSDPTTPSLYAGYLFSAFFSQNGVPMTGTIKRGKVPAEANLVYLHTSSRDLAKISEGLFLYSNNFIANQVFLVLGAEVEGAPANVDKGQKVVREDVDKIVGPGKVQLVEGSGLDPRNTATASAITSYLAAVHKLLPNYSQLLSERNSGAIRAKTGTYSDFGVRAMAGYLLDASGNPYASFALLCDGRGCSRRSFSRFDSVLEKFSAAKL